MTKFTGVTGSSRWGDDPGLPGWALNTTTSVLVRGRCDTHRGESNAPTQAARGVIRPPGPPAKANPQPPGDGRQKEPILPWGPVKRHRPADASPRFQPSPGGLLASRTARGHISIVFSHFVCGNLLRQPQTLACGSWGREAGWVLGKRGCREFLLRGLCGAGRT